MNSAASSPGPDSAARWLSFHVFEAEPIEPLLLDCVAGIVRHLKRQNAIMRFFFVRYAEAGYHARLRFEAASGDHESTARETIKSALHRFLAQRPGPAVDVIEARYEPELQRYGGRAGVEIAEQHFDFSTEMALRMLERTRKSAGGGIAARIGLMLEASLALTAGFGFSRTSIDAFFGGYYASAVAAIHLDDPRAAFGVAAARQQARLSRIGLDIFGGRAVGPGWAAAWIDHGQYLARRLGECGICPRASELTNVSGTLLSSYIHMFANRLGLFGWPEAYLCYLAQHLCRGTVSDAAS